MRIKTFACLLAGIIATSDVFASEWIGFSISETKLPSLLAYEKNSVKKSPNGLSVRVAQIFPENNQPVDLSLLLYSVDCNQLRFRLEQINVYLRGKQIDQGVGDKKWTYALPGTSGEQIINVACFRRTSDYVFKGSNWSSLTKWGQKILKGNK